MPLSPSTYLLASSAVGVAQVVDAVAHLKWKGRSIEVFTAIFALTEFVWAGVSYFVWRDMDDSFPLWLPVSFIAYVAAFTAAGMVIGFQDRKAEVNSVSVPGHLAIAGGLFGVYFSIASLAHVAGA